VNGKLAPTFGNVCMDMTMINLNGITAKEGDEVEIFGCNRPIQDLATELETITYEIMTTVSHRVVRIYVE
jgi:alanine racemase